MVCKLLIQMSKNIEPHILHKFQIGQLLGSGAYGHVWKVREKISGKQYALKKVFGAFRNSIDAQRTYRQVEILFQLNHPNVITLHRVIPAENPHDLYLLFQLMEADLLALIGSKILSSSHHTYILFQLLQGVVYLHGCSIIHRDLKPSNLLIDSDSKLKICDFGLARTLSVSSQSQILSEQVATKWYRAPELLLGSRNYSFPADLWSIGCIAAQLLTGKTLFAGSSTLQQLEKIVEYTGRIAQEDVDSLDSPVAQCLLTQINPKKRQFSDYFSLINKDYHQLLRSLLQFNPGKRITANKALQFPIFDPFRDEVIDYRHLLKQVRLQLQDDLKYKVKQYRDQILSSFINKEISRKKNFKKQSSKHIGNKHKSLTKCSVNSNAKNHLFAKKERNKSLINSLQKQKNPSKEKKLIQKQKTAQQGNSLIRKTKSRSPCQKSPNQKSNLFKNQLPSHHPIVSSQNKLKKVGKKVKYYNTSKH